MLRYIIYRLLQLIPVMLLVSIFVFAFVHVLPGDAIDALAGEAEAHDPAVRAALEKELGLDKPVYVQYLIWLKKIVLHGDFGKSITTRRSIGVEVFKRIPATVYLAVAAVIISLLIAVPLGTIAAMKRRTLADYAVTTGAVVGISIPQFWFAILCVLFFALYLGWLPASEYVNPLDDPWLGLKHLLLPGAALGVRLAAITTRLTRSSMLDEVRKDYVDTARSVGLPEWRVIFKYTLRNALIPTVTVAGLQFGGLLGGTVIIETIFAWPGIGLTLYDAIVSRDYPTVQASILIIATAYVLVNLFVDIIYRLLNPRIRLA
ncbi:MAG TPA: ABC transporter permease [Candidatus Tectomicrobia bacterium]|nr:ABC transporter permease [Candidatus Tectomicrobia bacterium]